MKNYLFIYLFITCSIWACSDKQNFINEFSETEISEEEEALIRSSSYFRFDNKDEVMSEEVSTKTNRKKDVLSMWDAYQEVLDYAVDPEQEDKYRESVKKYSRILRPIGNGEYDMIISDPIVARKFNSNGVLAVGNEVYLAGPEKITKYSIRNDRFKKIHEFPRGDNDYHKEYTPPARMVIKSGEWTSEPISYRLSKRRRVKIWLFAESYGDLGASVGAKSKYYRKSWKDHKGDNRLEFKTQELKYTDKYGSTRVLYNEKAVTNTKDRVYLYATNRYTNMDLSKVHSIKNPVVRFWRGSSESSTAFVFDHFVVK